VLTPSADPWNQTLFAAPMIALYLASILIAWMVTPRGQAEEASGAPKLRLVIAAMRIDQALR